MVLASENLAGLATLLALTTANSQAWNKFFARRLRTSESISAVFGSAMLLSYAAVRLLAESGSPNSVVPIYMAVVLLLFSSLSKGEYYYREWLCKGATVVINSAVIVIFLLFEGLGSFAESAGATPLDRELKWYHVVLVHFSSYRWFIVNAFFAYFNLHRATRTAGWILVVVQVTLLWVLTKGTGTTVAPSPWGILDEILLNDTVLLNVVLSVVTFTMIMDQITTKVAAKARSLKSKRIAWEEFEGKVFDKIWPCKACEEEGNRKAAQDPEGSQAPETCEAEHESAEEKGRGSCTNVEGQAKQQIV